MKYLPAYKLTFLQTKIYNQNKVDLYDKTNSENQNLHVKCSRIWKCLHQCLHHIFYTICYTDLHAGKYGSEL